MSNIVHRWGMGKAMMSVDRFIYTPPNYTRNLLSHPTLTFAGDLSLLERRRVAIVGSRKPTDEGTNLAVDIVTDLTKRGVVIVSGLARGIDAVAHMAATDGGGKTIAVIGTPVDVVYPVDHARLQEFIWRKHLLVSPFECGDTISPKNFPIRNRVMARISEATIVVDASDMSGTIHQVRECARLGRPVFIARHLAENKHLIWPKKALSEIKKSYVYEDGMQVMMEIGLV